MVSPVFANSDTSQAASARLFGFGFSPWGGCFAFFLFFFCFGVLFVFLFFFALFIVARLPDGRPVTVRFSWVPVRNWPRVGCRWGSAVVAGIVLLSQREACLPLWVRDCGVFLALLSLRLRCAHLRALCGVVSLFGMLVALVGWGGLCLHFL